MTKRSISLTIYTIALLAGVAYAETQSAAPEVYTPDWSRYEDTGLFGGSGYEPPTQVESPAYKIIEQRFLKRLITKLDSKQRRDALLGLAEHYEEHRQRTKAAATYEKLVETYPQDPIAPEIYMRLGFIYRELGAYETALRKFYSVLNASLAIDREEIDIYRQLSVKAQLEIADTHHVMGDYADAAQFYERLQRVELSIGDRAIVDFKHAYTKYLQGHYSDAISGLNQFIADFPQHELVPQSQFLLAHAFKQMDQPDKALSAVLELLRTQEQNSKDGRAWAYWKRRTGNELSNAFYEQGDFASALKIYQSMAVLSEDPQWQWPVIYQIGLCFERLRMAPRSIEAYRIIIRGAEKAIADGQSLPAVLQDLHKQAIWRLEHLQWVQNVEGQLNELNGNSAVSRAL